MANRAAELQIILTAKNIATASLDPSSSGEPCANLKTLRLALPCFSRNIIAKNFLRASFFFSMCQFQNFTTTLPNIGSRNGPTFLCATRSTIVPDTKVKNGKMKTEQSNQNKAQKRRIPFAHIELPRVLLEQQHRAAAMPRHAALQQKSCGISSNMQEVARLQRIYSRDRISSRLSTLGTQPRSRNTFCWGLPSTSTCQNS